jgi:predicted GNAT family acetyltransferase/copper chaperone CopZ
MQRTYEVEGMHCQSCERKVGAALRAVPGVRDAEVSVSTRIATLEADDDVRFDDLDASVRKAGDYHLRAPSNGVSHHDSGHLHIEGDTRDTSEIEHDAHGEKFYVVHDGRESSLTYSRPRDHVIALEHTYVPPSDRNHGIAESLTRRALGYAEEHGLKVLPECAYVRRFIDLHEEFQPLLADATQAKSAPAAHSHQHKSAEERSKLATYWPLLLTVAYLVGGTAVAMFVAQTSPVVPSTGMFGMSVFMGLFFVVFSFFKMLDVDGFAKAYSSYDIVAERWLGWGYIYPFVELALGLSFLLGITATGHAWPIATNVVTLVVMVVGTIGVVNAVVRGRDIQCGCLGTMFDLPMSTVTIVEDVSMALMAAGMLVMLV